MAVSSLIEPVTAKPFARLISLQRVRQIGRVLAVDVAEVEIALAQFFLDLAHCFVSTSDRRDREDQQQTAAIVFP